MTTALSDAERRALLHELHALRSDADAHPSLMQVFLPLEAHQSALDPRVMIIRGERGAGKTALFRFLHDLDSARIDLQRVFPRATRSVWVEGFSEIGRSHPSAEVLDGWAQGVTDDARIRSFWFGHLIGRMSTLVKFQGVMPPPPPPKPFLPAWSQNQTDPAAWVDLAQAGLAPLTSWLDRFDETLVKVQTHLFVTYDHLDKIGLTRPETRRRFASALLSMWLSLSNRYERLRPKVFLREDLFKATLSGSSDASKMETRSVPLSWSTEDLYRLLLRHLGASDELRGWLSGPRGGWYAKDPVLGYVPASALPEEGPVSQRAFAERLAGSNMGEGVKKGFTYRWIPNHLQDAHGSVVPRSILNLVAFAAEQALARGPRAGYEQLLHYTELQASLEKTSLYRVNELAEEHKVVGRMEALRGILLLADPEACVARLGGLNPHGDDGFGTDGQAVFDELVRIGVLSVRSDGRVDVPDIYRSGFGIKRKGGVARLT